MAPLPIAICSRAYWRGSGNGSLPMGGSRWKIRRPASRSTPAGSLRLSRSRLTRRHVTPEPQPTRRAPRPCSAHVITTPSNKERTMRAIAHLIDDALSVEAEGFSAQISVKEISRYWDALSHYPDRRARLELSWLEDRLNNFAAIFAAIQKSGGNA